MRKLDGSGTLPDIEFAEISVLLKIVGASYPQWDP